MAASAPALFDLRNRAVVVTGGATGIGRVYSEHLLQAGAQMVIADLDVRVAEDAANALRTVGGKAIAVEVDIADEAAVGRMAQAAATAFGRVDGLINNAALMSALPRRPWHEIPVQEWDRVMAVNQRGLFLCCRAVFPVMRAQRSGSIVNISSNRVLAGAPKRLQYMASKAGVIGFTRASAREVGEFDIRVNAITQGLTLSDTQAASSDPDHLANAAAGRALARPQVPTDLVGTVMFLVSDASAFITGQTINVDGGQVMH